MNAYSICQIFVFIWITICSNSSIVTWSANVTESKANKTSMVISNSNTTGESMASAVQQDPAANEDSFNVSNLQFNTILEPKPNNIFSLWVAC